MSKKLIAYFSASGTTKTSAEKIAKLLNGDLYEIKPAVKYETKDLNWNDPNSRTTIECKNRNCRPEMADKNANIANYDTILIGFPVWWYLAPNIILTFLESYDFTGKKVVIWGTSQSSHMGETMVEIRKIAKGANVVEGIIFDGSHRKDADYQKFVASI
jgi:flavodoxin